MSEAGHDVTPGTLRRSQATKRTFLSRVTERFHKRPSVATSSDRSSNSGITRRRLLGVAAALTGAAAVDVAANALGIQVDARPTEVKTPIEDPTNIMEGKFRLIRGATLRKDPSKLAVYENDPQGHSVDTNVVSWEQVESFNGVHINEPFDHKPVVFIENPDVVMGYNPDLGAGGKPSPWIKLRCVTSWPMDNLTRKEESYLYVNVSKHTANTVQLIEGTGKVLPVKEIKEDTIKTDDRTFNRSDVGQITFPKAA